MQRRQFVALVGTGISGTLAGCSKLSIENETPSKSNEMSHKEVVTPEGATPTLGGKTKAKIIESKFVHNPPGTSPSNSMWALIKNTGEVPLGYAAASIKLYSKAGSIRNEDTVRLYALKQGQIWEIYASYVTVNDRDPPVKASIELIELDQRFVTPPPPPEVKLSNVDFKPGMEPVISGNVTNTVDTPIRAIVTTQFFGEQEHVLGTSFKIIDIGPNKTNRFKVSFNLDYYSPKQATGYELFIKCNR